MCGGIRFGWCDASGLEIRTRTRTKSTVVVRKFIWTASHVVAPAPRPLFDQTFKLSSCLIRITLFFCWVHADYCLPFFVFIVARFTKSIINICRYYNIVHTIMQIRRYRFDPIGLSKTQIMRLRTFHCHKIIICNETKM